MGNIFIGWSGNKDLADEIAVLLNKQSQSFAIVGGGKPKDMFIGAQVIDQINRCDLAILLVEDKNGIISPNLLFEWGYILAKFSVNNVHAFLINKKAKDLPSDLLGSWVNEILYNKENQTKEEIASEIVNIFLKNNTNQSVKNYFDLISNWKQVYALLTSDIPNSNQSVCEYILSGCLAAYYYQDNNMLRQVLNTIKINDTISTVVIFAKAYVDVFLKSDNMTKALSQTEFFNCMQTFEMVLKRNKLLSSDVEMLLDILCYDVYGLSCMLYLKNGDLDSETIKFCSEKAKTCFEKDIEMLETFNGTFKNNKCLNNLLRSYIFNDIGHLYRDAFKDNEKFLHYLSMSLEERKNLYQSFTSLYSNNIFLANKLEQEYIIALSEQCNYMDDSFLKTMYQQSVLAKYEEWEKELVYTSSLTDRIKDNINKFKKS